MSRNIGSIFCDECGEIPVATEAPRPLTKGDAGAYFKEYQGLVCGHGECLRCGALYLIWYNRPEDPAQYNPKKPEMVDLSFRSSFDDEARAEDLPRGRWPFPKREASKIE
jgi:hypothetical protein